MKPEQFRDLKLGDIIRHKLTGESCIVVHHLGNGAYVVNRTTTATNPSEWVLVRKEEKDEQEA